MGTWRLSRRVIGFDYKLDTWRSFVLAIIWFYDSALRPSAQIHGERPCQYMDLVNSPWIMNSRCIFQEYHAYMVERVLNILEYHFNVYAQNDFNKRGWWSIWINQMPFWYIITSIIKKYTCSIKQIQPNKRNQVTDISANVHNFSIFELKSIIIY